jgi:uncharacterized protein
MQIGSLQAVRMIRDVLIPMRDGVRLAANLYLPEKSGQYPGVFSFYPYLKDGWYGIDHDPHHRFFASCGYAVMQVDFRGTGASEGRNPHPFDLQERLDGFDIVEWMAVQPWCTGNVGVWGISYGGITALSIASTQPPHLKAIVPIHATFDNYEWLLRTHGCRGLLLADVDWGTRMAACNLLPPVRQDADGRWASLWRQRLAGDSPWFMDWHGQPPNPEFWHTRKIPLTDIKVPTFAICGWHDAYTAPAFRVFEQVNGPTRVLIGPWKHALPDLSPVSPIGGAHEIVRWWDRWLKDVRNEVENEPPVTIFVQGRDEWRYESEWPIARTAHQRLYLTGRGKLSSSPPSRMETVSYKYDSRVGTGSIGYNGHRLHLGVPADQSADDHASISFTGSPLERDLEITGEPRIQVVLSANVHELTLVAKLCLVSHDGSSRVISRGNANPARADAHAVLAPLQPGERRRISFSMKPTSIVARAGERLRLCLAGSDFPELWPTPTPYTAEIYIGQEGEAFVDVPTVPARPQPIAPPVFEPARNDLSPTKETAGPDHQYDAVNYRLDAKVVSFETRLLSNHQIDGRTLLVGTHDAKVTTDADNPGTTNLITDTRFEIQRDGDFVSVRVRSMITHYAITAHAEVDLNGLRFWETNWHKALNEWINIEESSETLPC